MINENNREVKEQMMHGVKVAIEAAGSQRKLSKVLGFTRSTAVYLWTKTGYIPLKHVPVISKMYDIPLHVLRPDFFEEPSD